MRKTYYTDGSAKGNGTDKSSGGYGVVEIDENNNIIWQDQGFKSPTTNNEMELMAILTALQHINKSGEVGFLKPVIYSDSAYCVNIINDWMYNWEKNGWIKGDGKVPENLEVVQAFFEVSKMIEVTFVKVKGHSKNSFNELADNLATGKVKPGNYLTI